MNIFIFNKKTFSLLILVLMLFLLLNLNKGHHQDPLTKSSYFLFSEIHTASVNVHQSISDTLKKYLFLLSLREKNSLLEKQNQKLETKYQMFEEVFKENQRLKKLQDFSLYKPYQLLSAQVTSTDFLSTNELFSINKGSSQGVKKFMAVLHPKGIVGHVFRVSPNSSQVLTLISPLSSLPARNQRSRIQGLVENYQKNFLVFHYMDSQDSQKIHPDLKVGDKIVSRQSEQFPAGFLIGQIHFLDKNSNPLNPKAYIQPAVSFHSLEEVLIILNLNKTDRKKPLQQTAFKQQKINENKK